MKSVIFFTIFTGFIFGLVAGMFVIPLDYFKYSWIALIVLVFWGIFCIKNLRAKKFLPITLLFLCFVSIGLWRINVYHTHYSFTDFDKYNNQVITIAGTVNETPTFKPGKQLVRVHPEFVNGVRLSKTTRDIVIQVSNFEEFSRGDRIVASGKFSARADFESDTGRIVQYRLMSYARKIAGDIRTPQIISHEQVGTTGWKLLASIKQKFLTTMNQLFVSPASGLLAGMMIGDTSSLDGNILDVFRAVGLIHIVVLSGYNITLVANFFVGAFASLGYYRRLIAAMIALSIFILIVGISQTAMRAGIMALAAFAARYYIRPYVVTRGIAIALLVMVWISPYALLFDLSLQLSFLATVGIVYVFPILQVRYEQLAESGFGEILLQTVAVNILTLPMIIYQMGYFSLISFPINILVLGMIPWLTVGGFAATFIGMIATPIGQVIAFPIQIIIDTIIKIAAFTATHDPFVIQFPVFSVYILLAVYFIIGYLLIRNNVVSQFSQITKTTA